MRLAADLVVAVHMGFIAFLLAGGFLAWRWSGLAPVHIVALVVSSAIYLGGFACPLTALERHLRTLAGEPAYQDGFIAHYLVAPFYSGGMTTALGYGIVGVVVALSAVAYGARLLATR
jgi:hypothetical protein